MRSRVRGGFNYDDHVELQQEGIRMTKALFQDTLLNDTLDMTRPVTLGSIMSQSGVTVTVHERGFIEVIPPASRDVDKHVIISAGVHGNETTPLEMMDRWMSDILAGKLDIGCRCLFIIAHPEAINQHTRFIDTNLNRLFDDQVIPTNAESVIAARIKHYTEAFFCNTPKDARWHLDLHCSIRRSKHHSFAVSPRSRNETRSLDLVNFLSAAQVEALMLANAPSSTYSWYSAEHHSAQALTIELGQVNRIGENDLAQFKAFDRAIRFLLAGQGLAMAKHDHLPVMYRVTRTLMRLNQDFNFLFAEDVENFTSFVHGEVFGHDGDKPLMAQNANEAIVFPNPRVEIGQRAALMVCQVTIRYEHGQIIFD